MLRCQRRRETTMAAKDDRPGEMHIRRTRDICSFLVPALRETARRHGYALTEHGSRERDIDLVAIPWEEMASDATALVGSFFSVCVAVLGFATWSGNWREGETFDPPSGSLPNPERKPHGRLGWTIILGGGPYIDLSVMPRTVPPTGDDDAE